MQWLIDVSTTGIIHSVAAYRVCGPSGDEGPQLATQEQEKTDDLNFKVAETINGEDTTRTTYDSGQSNDNRSLSA
jgi:hypothetical protein